MIDPTQNALNLRNFSSDWTQVHFDCVNLQKPISALTLSDLIWCLRKRIFTEPIVDLVLDKIRDNWTKIDQHYTTEICEWYEESIRLIITFPFSFWDTKHQTHNELCTYVCKSEKRNLEIEKSMIVQFLSYTPQIVCWSKADDDSFKWNLGIGQGMDLAGNIIEAQQLIKKLKIAILHQQSVFIESSRSALSTEEEILNFIAHEYAEYGELMQDVQAFIAKEKKIKTIGSSNL